MTNFEFEYTTETTATPAAVWALWSDVSTWPTWDSGVQHVRIDGPFETGATGEITVPGQPPLPFRMVEVRPNEAFVDETDVPGGVLRFLHRIERVDDTRIRVTHRVEIDGDQALADHLGPELTTDMPDTVNALVKMAE